MSFPELVYIGVPVVCFAGMVWLIWEDARIKAPEFREYNERMAAADRELDRIERELSRN
jgi:hypothetical protein